MLWPSFIFLSIALGLIWAGIGYVRDRGMIPRAGHVVAAIAWALTGYGYSALVGYDLTHTILITCSIFLGMLVWQIGLLPKPLSQMVGLTGGWGLYFSAYHGIWQEHEVECRAIDWVGKKVYPFTTSFDLGRNRARGTLCMALRGLYIAGLFFLLAYAIDDIDVAWVSLVGILQGFAFGIMRNLPRWGRYIGEGTMWAAPLIAFIYGTTTGLVLVTHAGV
jgi:hypothetical protein